MRLSSLQRKCISLVLFLFAVLAPEVSLLAWTDHPLITYPVLAAMPEVRDAPPIPVETLDAFLMAEEKGLAEFLAEEEAWARKNLPRYAPRPDSLAFTATGTADDVRLRFYHAIRINPRTVSLLYLQLFPGADNEGKSPLLPRGISFLTDTTGLKNSVFVGLKAGETVSPLAVAVTATNEPDLGVDIGLFEDNETDFGKLYGFGIQPFGNPHLKYGSQAPFQMGFYHEPQIIYTLAGFLQKTYPEYRIHLYKSLAAFAFRTGHPYWGWRFTGCGLHYLADLAEPYHATVLPGVSTVETLWINTLDMLGVHGPKNDAVQLVSNRHLALEKFLQLILQKAYHEENGDNPILAALSSAGPVLPYSDATPRDVIAKIAHDKAAETDRILVEAMPPKFVSDPHFELGTSEEREQIVDKIRAEKGQSAIDRLTLLIRDLLIPFAQYGPSYVHSILNEAKNPNVADRTGAEEIVYDAGRRKN